MLQTINGSSSPKIWRGGIPYSMCGNCKTSIPLKSYNCSLVLQGDANHFNKGSGYVNIEANVQLNITDWQSDIVKVLVWYDEAPATWFPT